MPVGDLHTARVVPRHDGTDVSTTNPLPVEVVDFTSSPVVVTDEWEIATIADLDADSNDKMIVVPADTEWQILWLFLTYTSDANAGDRQIQIDFRDPAGTVIGQQRTGIVQAASLTRYYMFGCSLADLIGFRDTDFLMTPIPPTLFLVAGSQIRIRDNNGVSANDDMLIQIQVARR